MMAEIAQSAITTLEGYIAAPVPSPSPSHFHIMSLNADPFKSTVSSV